MYQQQGHIPKALNIFKFHYINNKVIFSYSIICMQAWVIIYQQYMLLSLQPYSLSKVPCAVQNFF